jgi:hypothetical protein
MEADATCPFPLSSRRLKNNAGAMKTRAVAGKHITTN